MNSYPSEDHSEEQTTKSIKQITTLIHKWPCSHCSPSAVFASYALTSNALTSKAFTSKRT